MTIEVEEWADRVEAAALDLARAQTALQQDKQRRAKFLPALLRDWLGTTPAERAFENESARLETVRAEAQNIARQWILNEAREALHKSAEDVERHSAQVMRREDARARLNRVRPLLRLAEDARYKLDDAVNACSSASGAEMLDLVSDNPGFSLMSYGETSRASGAVKSAGEAVEALARAMPKKVAAADEVAMPSDLLDLVFDVAFEPAFDVLSWFNMGQLDNAAEQCRRASEALGPLLARLRNLDARLNANVGTEADAVAAIESPYLRAAAASVPVVIAVQTPRGLS